MTGCEKLKSASEVSFDVLILFIGTIFAERERERERERVLP